MFCIGNGLLMIMDNESSEVMVLSKYLMDFIFGIFYEELFLNLFLFNFFYGVCFICKGLGMVYKVDMDKVIFDNIKFIN